MHLRVTFFYFLHLLGCERMIPSTHLRTVRFNVPFKHKHRVHTANLCRITPRAQTCTRLKSLNTILVGARDVGPLFFPRQSFGATLLKDSQYIIHGQHNSPRILCCCSNSLVQPG